MGLVSFWTAVYKQTQVVEGWGWWSIFGREAKELKKMEIAELSALSSSRAADFEIQQVLGTGQNGLVVSAKCHRMGLPDKQKLYAVKLLFNFTHEYTSVVRNAYENEWLILSRLMPHENIVRFWSQFISPIPEAFAALLPAHVKKHATRRNKYGEMVRSKGQFLVLDYHLTDLETWVNDYPAPMQFEALLSAAEQIMEAVVYLEKNLICHLDLKMSNILVTRDNCMVLCDFGCAVQFTDNSFCMPFVRGMLPGGNKAHLAPEVLNTYHRMRRDPAAKIPLNYSKQESFAVGVLIHELATREHPLYEYPLGCTTHEIVSYTDQDVPALSGLYPKSFCSIVSDLLALDSTKRLSMQEALTQLRVCCIKGMERESASSPQAELEKTKQERDLAKAKLQVVATERDFAVSQMKEMAEQVQSIAGEFKSMADHCDHTMKELEQVSTHSTCSEVL